MYCEVIGRGAPSSSMMNLDELLLAREEALRMRRRQVARWCGSVAPSRRTRRARGHGAVDVGGAAVGDAAHHFLGRRVVDVEAAGASGCTHCPPM